MNSCGSFMYKTHLILCQEYITWYNNAIVCRIITDHVCNKFHLSDLLRLYEKYGVYILTSIEMFDNLSCGNLESVRVRYPAITKVCNSRSGDT